MHLLEKKNYLKWYFSFPLIPFHFFVHRPRPDFFERCFSVPPLDPHALAKANCDRPEELENEGYKSFPSGHATSKADL